MHGAEYVLFAAVIARYLDVRLVRLPEKTQSTEDPK